MSSVTGFLSCPAHRPGLSRFQFHDWIRYLYSSFLPVPAMVSSSPLFSELSYLLAGLINLKHHGGLGAHHLQHMNNDHISEHLDTLNQSPD